MKYKYLRIRLAGKDIDRWEGLPGDSEAAKLHYLLDNNDRIEAILDRVFNRFNTVAEAVGTVAHQLSKYRTETHDIARKLEKLAKENQGGQPR